MKKLLLFGLAAIFLLTAASLLLIWRAGEAGGPSLSPSPSLSAAAPAVEPTQPAAVAQPEPPPAAEPAGDPAQPRVGAAVERDPRNDIRRPSDQRADLLVDERLAKMEGAMAQLNRRTAQRKEEMTATGEIRPSVPVAKQPRR